MYLSFSGIAALAAIASAQKTVVITAGSGGFVFSPDSVTADVGDTLEFHFVGSIHTAVSGDFSSPCSGSSTGFDSGPISSVCPPQHNFSTLTNTSAVRCLSSKGPKH
jgi:plastocyanin